MITYLKMEFSRVKAAMQFLIPTVPTWAVVVWFVVMLPIGVALYPIAWIARKILFWKMGISEKEVKQMYEEFSRDYSEVMKITIESFENSKDMEA